MNREVQPFISVIVPCRNEIDHISRCLDSILSNDHPSDRMEIMVIDGMSVDGTRDVIRKYEKKHPRITSFDNPKKILASAWNIGIKSAKGDIIMALNAHGVFKNDYISNCVKHFMEYSADYIGGVIVSHPRDDSYVGGAIATALSHPFGVGDSYFRIGLKEPMFADTAAFGGYKKAIFEKVGLYNECLGRSQDMEFHARLRRAGGSILLAPDMICDYYLRSDPGNFIRDSFVNGFWVLYPFKFTNIALSVRHLIPLAFVSGLICLGGLSAVFSVFRSLFLLVIALYASVSIYSSARIAAAKKNIGFLFLMPVIFITLHVLYGMGTFYGGLKVLASKQFWGRLF